MDEGSLWFQIDDLIVRVAPEVQRIWRNHRQNGYYKREACGVLIGYCLDSFKEFRIENVTTPGWADKLARYSFLLRDPRHQRTVDNAHARTKGTSVYLGTWHTHPQKIPVPSHVDERDWRECMARNRDRRLFFVIVGLERTSMYTAKGSGFVSLTQDRGL
uniref:Integrative and conjugative element protein, VC0181 family n=1 Tax=Candidatus Kentrum sp. LPFa TaxID=2126335 RepID=A0A450W2E1_9GAMM|nr:MAG: integrative and conjugative element protein, VC0181 family [Candidatus Kentron sp. LPFa]